MNTQIDDQEEPEHPTSRRMRALRKFLKEAKRVEKAYERGRMDNDTANARLWDAVEQLQEAVDS